MYMKLGTHAMVQAEYAFPDCTVYTVHCKQYTCTFAAVPEHSRLTADISL